MTFNSFDDLFVADMLVFDLKPMTDPLNLVKLETLWFRCNFS